MCNNGLKINRAKKLVAVIIGCVISCATFAQGTRFVNIQNPSKMQRKELISIPYKDFQKHFSLKDSLFTVINQDNQQQLDYQLERNGQAHIQNILIAVDIPAHEQLQITVSKDPARKIVSKAYARFIPERKDDFAWENDLVAFRAYGKALEGTAEDAQGYDFWAKRTNVLVIDDWYKKNDYHKDQGDGLDYYSVGQTLGVGDMAFYYKGEIKYSKHYRRYAILDNGPLRTKFSLFYDAEEIDGNWISIVKTISLDAGSQFNKIELTFSKADNSPIPIVIGIARRKEEQPAFTWNAAEGSFSYWEPAYLDNITGTGLMLPEPKAELVLKDNQFLFKVAVTANETYSYYAGAAFNKAGKILDAATWEGYITAQNLFNKNPLILKFSE